MLLGLPTVRDEQDWLCVSARANFFDRASLFLGHRVKETLELCDRRCVDAIGRPTVVEPDPLPPPPCDHLDSSVFDAAVRALNPRAGSRSLRERKPDRASQQMSPGDLDHLGVVLDDPMRIEVIERGSRLDEMSHAATQALDLIGLDSVLAVRDAVELLAPGEPVPLVQVVSMHQFDRTVGTL